jgi:hypothetical protein
LRSGCGLSKTSIADGVKRGVERNRVGIPESTPPIGVPSPAALGVTAVRWAEILEGQVLLQDIAQELGLTLGTFSKRLRNESMAEVAASLQVPREDLLRFIATAIWASLTVGTRAAFAPIPSWLWEESGRIADRKRRRTPRERVLDELPRKHDESEDGHRFDTWA